MKATISFISALLFAAASVEAFAPAVVSPRTTTTSLSASRRDTIEAVFAAAALVATPLAAQAEEDKNDFIESLKARSEINKETNKNFAMRSDKLSKRDFGVVSARPSFVNVKNPSTGSITLLTREDFATLESDGKIRKEYGTRTKQGGGEITDYNNITYYFVE